MGKGPECALSDRCDMQIETLLALRPYHARRLCRGACSDIAKSTKFEPLSSRDAAESYDPNINASNRHQVAVPRSLCPRLASTTSASPALFRMDMNHGSPTATSSGAMSSSTGAAGGSMSMGGGCKISMLWNWFVFDIGSDHAEAETPRWAPRPLGTLSAPASSRRTGRSKAP